MTAARKNKNGWQKTPTPNLFRWGPSGIYYLRARVGQKEAQRVSLKVSDYETARARVGPKLAEMRAAAPLRRGDLPKMFGDALKVVQTQIESDPSLKSGSLRAYQDVLKALKPGMPHGIPDVPLANLSQEQVEAWWKATAKHYAPATANFHLLVVRRALKTALENGAMVRDPARDLKRVPVPTTKLRLITPAQFSDLVKAIREDGDEDAENAADWVEFACYTGARPEEANSVLWEHIDLPRGTLTIVGGAEGTKNRKTRQIPITDALANLLERIAARRWQRDGFVLVPSPYYGKILSRVSAAIGLPRLRRYDMRHLFATRCNEAGVDVPTFSRWLGHQDGGALAMKTYVHPHHEHEQRAALKVKF